MKKKGMPLQLFPPKGAKRLARRKLMPIVILGGLVFLGYNSNSCGKGRGRYR